MNTIPFQKLLSAIEFHEGNILIQFSNSSYQVTDIIPDYKGRYLKLEIYSDNIGGESELEFCIERNESIEILEDGSHVMEEGDSVRKYHLKFFLAVSNLSETTV
tara:strand:+ start:1999 stop:2310 length:312 start_codon:yes stop_codon:yes gene_type:complete